MRSRALLYLLASVFLMFSLLRTHPECLPNQAAFGFESSFEEWIELGGSGEQSVRFVVSPASRVARGNRAELTYDDGATEGEERWDAWKILIPRDYPDVTMEDDDSQPNRQLMGQRHQQPVFDDGEAWDRFTGQGESAPIGINYHYRSADDPSVFFLTYGTPPVPVAVTTIEEGVWIEVLLNIFWSRSDNGYVRMWVDDEEFARNLLV